MDLPRRQNSFDYGYHGNTDDASSSARVPQADTEDLEATVPEAFYEELARPRPAVPPANFCVMTPDELNPLMIPHSSDAQFGPRLREVLKEQGVAVVTGVLDEGERDEFEELNRVEYNEMESPQPYAMYHAQGELAWKGRVHPKVRDTFACAYDNPALSVSTDIRALFYSEEGAKVGDIDVPYHPPKGEDRQWLHTDQNTKTGLREECYQGILYIQSSEGEKRSTTVVWPKSHCDDVYGRLVGDATASFMASLKDPATGVHTGQYLEINHVYDTSTKESLLEEALAGSRRVPMPAGSLLLWSSRTVHQGWNGGPRLAVPVCWEPRARVPKEAAERKIKIAAAGLATSHSPVEGRVHPSVADRNNEAAKVAKPRVRPYCVQPKENLSDADWDKLWEDWEGKQFAEDVLGKLDVTRCAAALKPEILKALACGDGDN